MICIVLFGFGFLYCYMWIIFWFGCVIAFKIFLYCVVCVLIIMNHCQDRHSSTQYINRLRMNKVTALGLSFFLSKVEWGGVKWDGIIFLYMKTFGDEKWSNPLIPFWTVFLGMRNEATPNSVLNCFGDVNWSNPWIHPNRHPPVVPSLLLRGFLTLMLREFQCSWGISSFGNFFVPLQWGGDGGGGVVRPMGRVGTGAGGSRGGRGVCQQGGGRAGGTGGGLPTYLFLTTICLKLLSFT